MEAFAEQNRSSLKTSAPPPKSSKDYEERLEALIAVAGVFSQPLTAAVQDLYMQALSDLTAEQFQAAMSRAVRECRFFPRPAEIREFAGLSEKAAEDAEAMCAWQTARDFASKWICADIYGNYTVDQGCRVGQPPDLSEKILRAVRACRGWRPFKCTPDDPFLRKEFLDAYRLASAIARVPPDRLLSVAPVARLLEMPRPHKVAVQAGSENPPKVLKRIPAPLSEAEIRDRREMLRQQKTQLLTRRTEAGA